MTMNSMKPLNEKLRTFSIALVLVAEVGCIALVANMTFSPELLPAILTAFLLTGLIAILTHLTLRNISEKHKPRLLKFLLYIGGAAILLGFIGACLIFMPISSTNKSLSAIASVMLMVGLVMGIPLLITGMYEDNNQKLMQVSQESDQESSSDNYTCESTKK